MFSAPLARRDTVFGLDANTRAHAPWAASANAVAVRELDFHDTFLAEASGHPGDDIAPLLAVAQQCGCTGTDRLRGLIIAHEVPVNRMKASSLHRYQKDHLSHLAPGALASIRAILRPSSELVHHAVTRAAQPLAISKG